MIARFPNGVRVTRTLRIHAIRLPACLAVPVRLLLLLLLLPFAAGAQGPLSKVWVPDLGNATF